MFLAVKSISWKIVLSKLDRNGSWLGGEILCSPGHCMRTWQRMKPQYMKTISICRPTRTVQTASFRQGSCWRILTSVVTLWSLKNSRSAWISSRFLTEVARLFSNSSWASSIGYSNITFAYKRKDWHSLLTGWNINNYNLHLATGRR